MHSTPRQAHDRRSFLRRALAAGAAFSAPASTAGRAAALERPAVGPVAFDHVAVPIQNVNTMIAFYRALGFEVKVNDLRISVHFGDQKINFHHPDRWQNPTFTRRAAAATPPCGDFCWLWEGSRESLVAAIDRVGAAIEAEGDREGARNGGMTGQSIYIRDPDGNLLEFIRYG